MLTLLLLTERQAHSLCCSARRPYHTHLPPLLHCCAFLLLRCRCWPPGKEIEIDIEPTDTIERIKERVEEKEGIPPVQQRCGRAHGVLLLRLGWAAREGRAMLSAAGWVCERAHVWRRLCCVCS